MVEQESHQTETHTQHLLPSTCCALQFQQALERVRAGADVMPKGQLEQVIVAEVGPDWRSKVASFEDEPLAAASIGQVCHSCPF